MAQPAKWTTFLKRNIRQAKTNNNGNYAAALAEVSASWRVVKAQRTQTQANALQELARIQAEALQEAVRNRPEAVEAARIQEEADQEAARVQAEADREAARLQAVDEDLLSREGIDQNIPTAEELGGNDSVWKGGLTIGGRNSVKAWVRLDANGLVADRRVVKSTILHGVIDWKDGTKWLGDIRDVDNRVNMDYVLHRRLCTAPDGGTHFAKVRGYRNFPRERMYRVIGDWCDAGDLDAMITAYHTAFQYDDPEEYGSVGAEIVPKGTPVIPEPLVWRMLEQLLKTVLVMEQGGIDGPIPEWQQVIHRDFKAANVFLSMADGSRYPDVKLSDFEFAVETSTQDPFNPHVLREDRAGILSFQPMELKLDERTGPILELMREKTGQVYKSLEDDQILAAANLWGVGAIVYQLMHGHVQWDEQSWFKLGDPLWEYWNETVEHSYSRVLVEIVKTCLLHEPADRGTAREKLDIIQRTIGGNEKADRLRLARDSAADNEDVANATFQYPAPGYNRYALGMDYFQKEKQSTADLQALLQRPNLQALRQRQLAKQQAQKQTQT